eukprot:SAG22_NODE_209_length_15177_cov_9.282995_10_plen_64_part_00
MGVQYRWGGARTQTVVQQRYCLAEAEYVTIKRVAIGVVLVVVAGVLVLAAVRRQKQPRENKQR